MTSEITSSLLSNLFSNCILRGSFPNRLKIAEVTPLYKSGPTYKTTNYRPISILSPFPKTFEKIIYDRLNNYFSIDNALAKEQFGFKTKHSTNHVISDVTNKLQNLRDKNYSIFLILLDLSKAFDTVNHSSISSIFYLTTRKTPNKNKEQKQWPKNRLQRQNDKRKRYT